VADLSHERPNVYFELGYARELGKTVVTCGDVFRQAMGASRLAAIIAKNMRKMYAGSLGLLEFD
jgi:hypothetical protein